MINEHNEGTKAMRITRSYPPAPRGYTVTDEHGRAIAIFPASLNPSRLDRKPSMGLAWTSAGSFIAQEKDETARF